MLTARVDGVSLSFSSRRKAWLARERIVRAR